MTCTEHLSAAHDALYSVYPSDHHKAAEHLLAYFLHRIAGETEPSQGGIPGDLSASAKLIILGCVADWAASTIRTGSQ